MVGVSSPGVRVLDREGKAIVDGRHGDARLHVLLALLAPDVPQQPVVITPVSVADDVVKDNQLLEL